MEVNDPEYMLKGQRRKHGTIEGRNTEMMNGCQKAGVLSSEDNE